MNSAVFDPRTTRRKSIQASTWTLVLLEGVTAVVLLIAATWPLSSRAPVHLGRVLAAILAIEAILTLVFARRIRPRALIAQIFAGIAMTVLITGASTTAAGTILSCVGYVWVAMWVGVFCSPGWLLAALAAELMGAPVAALLNGHPLRTLISTLGVTVLAALFSAVLGYLVASLRRAALHDQLTGLLNRRGVDESLADMWGRRGRSPTSLIAIDLDGLKAVNDRGGHLAGDRMLVAFADELRAGTRADDLVGRLGGDEFVVVLPGASSAQATRWVQRLNDVSELDWSFGVSQRRGEEPLEPWLARADERLYAAKISSRS
jgi:diguanylate cyclase (GGDEF)-like protein